MPTPPARIAIFPILVVLAVTQIIGWGTVSLLSIVSGEVAADLGFGQPAAFAGLSVFYVTMGMAAPWLARPFASHGPRPIMMAGAALGALGFLLLALLHHPAGYFAAWVLLGFAGSAHLTTAAYIVLNDIAGPGARSAIATLMVASGLSSTIFWPITAWLAAEVGWRGTCLVFAALLAGMCLPLYALALPRRRDAVGPGQTDNRQQRPSLGDSTFLLIVAAISLNAFVTYGFSAILIELLQAQGLPSAQAIAWGSALGVVQVGARLIDVIGGARWDGVSTGLLAGLLLPVTMILLMTGDGSSSAVAVFIVLYGLASGAFAVARATMALAFYDKQAFTVATSRIALPINLLSAIAPPVMSALLTSAGTTVLLILTTVCSSLAALCIAMLLRRRPAITPTG